MLLQQTVMTKWNSRTKKYYENLGYRYTHMGDCLEVDVEHLKENSMESVELQCDYCGKVFSKKWCDRTKALRLRIITKDCCTECKNIKAFDTFVEKYGVDNPTKIKSVIEKTKQTNLDKYGVDNVFKSEVIKDKIKQTNLHKYGFEHAMQSSKIQEKVVQTNLDKYGVEYQFNRQDLVHLWSGENNFNWKGGLHNESRYERKYPKYIQWRNNIYEKYNYTCQKCLDRGGKLNAHHIYNWRDNEYMRYDEENGIVLCLKCHKEFHQTYGSRNTNQKQLDEFLSR